MSNPFKDEEPMGVFKETPSNQSPSKKVTAQAAEQQTKQAYSQLPKWDLLPPLKLISRGRKK